MSSAAKGPPETSSMRIQKQRAAIQTVQHANEQLKTDLARESRESRYVTNPAAMKSIARLQDQADMYAKKIEAERRKIESLDKQIAVTQERVLEQRQKMGGLNASEENNQMIARQIRTLENRLDKALVKFNESLAYNHTLREKIDSMRRERVVFDGIYKKLERELHEKKKEMSAIIEDSNNAYQARDKAQSEMIALRQQAEKDRAEFEAEWRELGELIDQDRKLRETLRQKQIEKAAEARSSAIAQAGGADVARTRGSPGTDGFAADTWRTLGAVADTEEQDSAQSYETALKRIQEATGVESVSDIVSTFLEAEEKNFSLFNFVNDLSGEIEKLELGIAETRNEAERHKGQGLSTDTQRRKVLRALEEQLAKTEAKASDYEARYQAAAKNINQLKTGIHSIFQRIGAGHTDTEQLLGNQGVTDSNMMQYLGLIEQRTTEILLAYAQSQTDGLTDNSLPAANSTVNLVRATSAQSRVAVQPPGLDDMSSGGETDQEDDERPLTRQEHKNRTIRDYRNKHTEEALLQAAMGNA